MRKHWDQIGQYITCPTKHKCNFLKKNLSYQQIEHNDLIGFQTPLQSDFKNLFLHPQNHQVT